ncbi:hypothetical protein K9L67_02105 [Candidatus Woesearchaeota archaeon]|nr:hypothetical protein [Candidatus Woesearchaeota archaeon]MCF7900997.1 hypothetical protein [Candidatus Woesearchaeota archaeon]MCF8013287.1 hypothetical protein [Candidatus Woesearchaeota archaeon]
MKLKNELKQYFVDYYEAYDPKEGAQKANKILNTTKQIGERIEDTTIDFIFKPSVFFTGALLTGYAALTIAATAISIPIQTGLELLQNRNIKTINAKLTEIKNYKTGRVGDVYTGNFTTENGQKITVYDQPQLFEGKFWGNINLSKLKEDTDYALKISENDYLGIFKINNFLDAKQIK